MIVVDLYHIFSSPMYYDKGTGQLIKGSAAMSIRNSAKTEIGFMKVEEGLRMNLGNPSPSPVYGKIYNV